MATDGVGIRKCSSEQALIGALILEDNLVYEVSEIVEPCDFADSRSRKLFESCLAIKHAGAHIDISTLYDMVREDKSLDETGWIEYIANLANLLPSPVNAISYAKTIHCDGIRRKILLFAIETVQKAQQPVKEIGELASETSEKLRQILDDSGVRPFVSIGEACNAAFEQMQDEQNGGGMNSIKLGFIDLDKMLSGLKAGSLTIIAARPAMGKTALALNILSNVCISAGKPGAIFSLEMTSDELAMRIISQRARVDGNALRTGDTSDEEWERVMSFAKEFKDAPLFIDDSSGITISALHDRAVRYKQQKSIEIIVVDYLQLLSSGSKKVATREQEISDITRGLKALAKELKVPVIALSQLNRAVEGRTDKRPILSDLRESGAIEQDADNIIFIHRPAYYDAANNTKEDEHKAEIIISKQRNGATGVVNLFWSGEYTLFDNLEKEASTSGSRSRTSANPGKGNQEQGWKKIARQTPKESSYSDSSYEDQFDNIPPQSYF